MEDNSDIIYNKFNQIKMLILFLMSRMPHPVAMDVITELAMCDERITYFDVTECIQKLVKTKHLKLVSGKYVLTAKGLRNSEILAEDLPYSIREKAKAAAEQINASAKRDSLIKTARTACDNGGYQVALSLSDGVGNILSIELLAANEQQASNLEKGFRKNAQTLYHDIAEIITKSR